MASSGMWGGVWPRKLQSVQKLHPTFGKPVVYQKGGAWWSPQHTSILPLVSAASSQPPPNGQMNLEIAQHLILR